MENYREGRFKGKFRASPIGDMFTPELETIMKKFAFALLALTATSSFALAQPAKLTDAQLDKTVAGFAVIGSFDNHVVVAGIHQKNVAIANFAFGAKNVQVQSNTLVVVTK
jgi:hypothetical protein